MKAHRTKLRVESLEQRIVLSLVVSLGAEEADLNVPEASDDELKSSDHHRPGHGGGPGGGGGGGGGGKPQGPPIDLATVAAHEIGHSLGIGHSTHPGCGSEGQPLMCPFYIGESFQLHAEDIGKINSLYPGTPTGNPGTWSTNDVTYSFTPDRARMESGGRNALFKSMNGRFGSSDVWQQIFADAFNLWEAASPLEFSEVADGGAPFNSPGAQGDIRIAAHGFDGASGVLAHAFFPPPNGVTAAGDAHFDKAENWQDLRGAASSSSSSVARGASARSANFMIVAANLHGPGADLDVPPPSLLVDQPSGFSAPPSITRQELPEMLVRSVSDFQPAGDNSDVSAVTRGLTHAEQREVSVDIWADLHGEAFKDWPGIDEFFATRLQPHDGKTET